MAPTRIFVVELRCLACGREHEITIGALVDLPTLPERCTHCGGSVLATSSSTRSVRVERPVSWVDERPRRGRPFKQPVHTQDSHPRRDACWPPLCSRVPWSSSSEPKPIIATNTIVATAFG